ncbi:MAG: hypothetical protein ACOC33_01085 [bacterium]
MAKKSNLTSIAKKGNTNTKRGRPSTKSEVNEPLNDKDAKAKKTVDDLLKDIDLSPKQKEEVTKEFKKIEGTDWLEEQVSVLTEKNEKLEKEASEAKHNYKKLYEQYETLKSGNVKKSGEMIPDSELTNGIKTLFDDLQKNMLGLNQQRARYTDAKISVLLKKFLEQFPFLREIKKF